MKNIIILAIAAILAVPFSASAQKTTVTRVNRENTYRKVKQEYRVDPAAPVVKQPREKSVWYQGEIDLGFAVGGEMTGPIVETVHGIRITKYVFVGAGVGLHYPFEYGDPLVPIFGDVKFYYPVNEKIAPFLNADVGCEVCEGGLFLSAGLGLKYKRCQFSAGVRSNDTYYGSYCYGFLKVGFTF